MDGSIEAILDAIYDPCSVAAGRPLSVWRMGLVLGWEMQPGGCLKVRFCTTFPGCTMSPHFTEAARDRLGALPGVDRVDVVVEAGFLWTEERKRLFSETANHQSFSAGSD
jgi:metal-sulfur cluster biosynthetic enzyme